MRNNTTPIGEIYGKERKGHKGNEEKATHDTERKESSEESQS